MAVDAFGKSSDQAISQFAAAARAFEAASHVEFPWSVVANGLDLALAAVFKVENPAAEWIYDKVKSALLDGLVAELTSRTSVVPELEAALRAGVAQLVESVTTRQRQAIEAVQREIQDAIHSAMLTYTAEGDFSNDTRWIGEMVAYLGFPRRGYDDVAQPILWYLNQEFDAMLAQANQQLLSPS
jgi:hypothetical protein